MELTGLKAVNILNTVYSFGMRKTYDIMIRHWIAGGAGRDGHTVGTILKFDNLKEEWQQIKDMKSPRRSHAVGITSDTSDVSEMCR